MLNKVAFLCADPWERFLPEAFQSYSRMYYQWVKKLAVLKNIKLCCKEYIDIYGEAEGCCENELFSEEGGKLQLLYVQSGRKELLKELFQAADLVIMGLPGSRKEFDKIYMSVFPWKDEILFLWSSHISRDLEYINRLSRECMLRKEQMIEIGEECGLFLGIKKAPGLMREL